jgi:Spy/CpxP family protein refolding chaperone
VSGKIDRDRGEEGYTMVKLLGSLLCVIVLAGWAGSQPFRPDAPPRGRRAPETRECMMRLKKELALTDEQEQELRSIKLELKRIEIETKAALATTRLDLLEMLRELEVNRSKIETLVKEMERIRTELELQRVDALLKARDVLNSEQFEIFRQFEFPMFRLLPRNKGGMFRR